MRKHVLAASLAIAVCSVSIAACSGNGEEQTTAAAETSKAQTTEAAASEEAAAEEKTEETEASEETGKAAQGENQLRIGQVNGAAHGNKCFTVGTAVIDENDRIVAAYLDEFQFLDDEQTGVPNSDAFVEAGYVAAGKVLGSKRVNNDYYSEMMAKAGSTVKIADNFDAVQAYAAGRTIEELEATAGKTPEEAVDAVSGATLADTAGYLKVIADAAKAAKENEAVSYSGDTSALTLKMIEAAAHGDKCFTTAAALTDGTAVILSYIDEYQFLDADQTGVPNSESFAEAGDISSEYVLGSKRENNAYYSGLMAKAGATMEIAANFDGIQQYADGKTIAELETLSGKDSQEILDAVTSATLADTAGYIAAIVEAAK
ncbi:MAG: FMN-binding protein [Eubacteriales bacterium]|nr:FMN-binding protein [Eubacteriales bacterium]